MKSIQYAFIILLIHFVNAQHKSDQNRKSLNIGGKKVAIGDAPWQVSVIKNRKLVCGGSLLSKNVVLTAASCVNDIDTDELLVRAGTTTFKTGGQLRKVKEAIPHPEYVEDKLLYNVALLQLVRAYNTSDNLIGRVKLPNAKTTLPSSIKVYGWGISSNKINVAMTKDLRYTKSKIYSEKRCLQYLPDDEDTDFVFCSGDRTKTADICPDDMGSPGISDGNVQFGIVSHSGACSQTHTTIFTSLSKHKRWITDQLRDFRQRT